MRRLAAAAWLLAAACSVPLEGAPCTTDANCPSEQACGYDEKCSTEAAQCTQPACRPGQKACGQDGSIVSCAPNGGSVCGTFPTSGGTLCGTGMTCGAGAVCMASYTVVISAPVAGTVIGQAGVDVTVVVTRASTMVPVATVSLTVDGNVFSPTGPPTQQGLVATYTIRYQPPPGTEKAVDLVAKAQPGGADETDSAPVGVVADTVAPTLSTVGLSCGPRATCWRDDTASITVTVTDPYVDPSGVSVALDLGAGTPVPMVAQGGGVFQAEVDLRAYAFPAFIRLVTATVTALDLAGNATPSSSSVMVSRLRWAKAVEAASPPQLTGAAVDTNGNVVVAGMNSRLYVLGPSGSTVNVPPVLGTIGIGAAPSIGPSAIWVASQDGHVYAAQTDGNAILSSCPPSVTAGTLFTPALTSAVPERAYSGGSNKRIYAVELGSPGLCTSPGNNSTDTVSTALLLSGGGIFAATATGAGAASIRKFQDSGDGAFTAQWATALSDGLTPCQPIEAPLAADASGGVLAACGNGQIYRVDRSGGTSARLITLAAKATESIVVRADGDLLVGTIDNMLHRLTPGTPPAFTEKWAQLPDLGAAVTGVALAARDALGVDAYVVTAAGELYAIDADATISGSPAAAPVWSTSGVTPPPLGTASLRFPAIAPARPGQLPTLYAPSADGKVYAVVVDSVLDPNAPWPKSHGDLANSGRAP